MNQKIIELYNKEREYQKKVFGDYSNNKSLNVSSFIQFIETYLIKAKNGYTNKWDEELPHWLIDCMEHFDQGTAPVNTYEALIKVFVLTGAAIETYCNVDINKWREDGIKQKWLNEEGE